MHNSVTSHILRHILRYTNGQQPDYYCHLMTLGIPMHLLLSWREYVSTVLGSVHVLRNGLQID